MAHSNRILMLGTGHAMVTRCYNTCFILTSGTDSLLVDAGGGNGIVGRFESAGFPFHHLSAIWVTHAHTDHIMGLVWVIRMLCVHSFDHPDFRIPLYGNAKSISVLHMMCENMLSPRYNAAMERAIDFRVITDSQKVKVGRSMTIQAIDLKSDNEPQLGFKATLSGGVDLVCLGDEPCKPHLVEKAKNATWLLCEAYCLDRDEARFKAHEKHHGTVKEAALQARALNVKNLLLYHAEDTDLEHRKRSYTAEAHEVFGGNVYVPDDLEIIELR